MGTKNMERPKTNTFDDTGRIHQIEYAIKSVSKANTSVGMIVNDGIIFIGINDKKKQFKDSEKIYRITKDITCCLSGLFADALQLIAFSRKIAQDYLYDFGVDVPLKHLVERLSGILQDF